MTAANGKGAEPSSVGTSVRVEIWSDLVCPWCYLGKRRFEQAVEHFEHGDEIEVVYRSFELDPTAPHGRTTPTVQVLASKYGMSAGQAESAQRQMEQRAAQDGLTFRMASLRSGNTRDAHRLVHLAKARGKQSGLMEALHRAYFTEQESIFDHASLTRVAVGAGLDSGEVGRVLAGDEYGPAVQADEEAARLLGVSGVPFFVIDRRYAVSGAQPPATILEALELARAEAGAA